MSWRTSRRLVWAAAAVYALLFTYVSVRQHDAFHSGYDLAIFDQLTWLLGHLHDPWSSVRGRPMLGDHWEPGVALLAPLGALSRGPVPLLAAQSVGLALAAPLLHAVARARSAGPVAAAVVAVAWLVSPLTQTTNLFDFHPECFVPALVVAGALALERERVGLFLVTALLACSLKEDVSLLYLVWGVLLALRRDRRWLALSGAAAAWFVLATTVAIERFGGNLDYYTRRFEGRAGRGGSAGGVVQSVVAHPAASLHVLLLPVNLTMLVALVASTFGLCLLEPATLLLAVPALAANLLSRYTPQHWVSLQYHLVPAAVCALAAAQGAHRLGELRGRARRWGIPAAAALAVVFVGVSPAVAILRGRYLSPPRDTPASAAARRAALRLVPPHAIVSAPYDLVPHLAERRTVYVFPEPFVRGPGNGELWSDADLRRRAGRVQWVLDDRRSPVFPGRPRQLRRVRRELPRLGFRVVFDRAGVELLHHP